MFNSELFRLRILRLSARLGNYAILGGVLLFLLGLLPAATFIFFIFAAIVVVFIILAWMLTLGQLFPFPETSMFDATGPIFEALSKFSHACAPYLFAVTAAFAVASIVISAIFGKKRVGRIVCSSIMLGLAVLGMILIYTVGDITV